MPASLFYGFFDADINLLLERYPAIVSGLDCLLTCMDSTTETATALRRLFPDNNIQTLGHFAVVSGNFALEHRQRLFTGFDEIFTFNPQSWRALSPGLWTKHFTSDWVELRDSVPNALRSIFEESQALGYTSDGCGLNVLTKDNDTIDVLSAEFGTTSSL